ncbi:MAG TPA: FAD-dependent oxidoreductase [Tepidisphaeraceae bacterium]|jgi:glycerol-3-phosphate dehydrogenase
MFSDRQQALDRVFGGDDRWDVIIVGGGATGVGAAVDAASRGYRTVLFEQSDFGKATSSRSTKLIHGGVRYLRQGRVGLVTEALRERSILLRNAPHLVHDLAFVVPTYRWGERAYYGIGLAIYGLLSGPHGFGRSSSLSRSQVLERLPSIKTDRLRGGVLYYDGQFDDSRLLINLVQTAARQGAAMFNYIKVLRTIHDAAGHVSGVRVQDLETGREHQILGRCVINATGAFCDALRQADDPKSRRLVAPSQGAHLVLDRSFLPGETALMLPNTDDGRVLFAIPWHEHVLVGTTDTPIENTSLEPRPLAAEVDFILETAGRYLAKRPTRADVLSAFAGIRPLVRNGGATTKTAKLSREHLIDVSSSGLITITGGKWTTYRAMAEECIDLAAKRSDLPRKPCITADLTILGGDDASKIQRIIDADPCAAPVLDTALPNVTAAHVRFAVRHEFARTLDDVLARRTRALHLDARAAIRMAPAAAHLIAAELGRDAGWEADQIRQFRSLAANYLVEPDNSGQPSLAVHSNHLPLVVGHRGNARHAPENTRISYVQALAAGAPIVEMDTRLTRDGEIVLMHDETLDRTTGRSGKLCDLTLAELAVLDAGCWKDGAKYEGEPVPTLSQIAEICRGRAIMMLDLKCPGQGPALARWLKSTNLPADQLILAPWEIEEGRALRQHLPGPPMILIAEKQLPLDPAEDAAFARLEQIGFTGFSIEWPILTPAFISTAHRHGMKIHTWTLNDPAEIHAAVAAGVDGVITDDPAAAIEMLRGALP